MSTYLNDYSLNLCFMSKITFIHSFLRGDFIVEIAFVYKLNRLKRYPSLLIKAHLTIAEVYLTKGKSKTF